MARHRPPAVSVSAITPLEKFRLAVLLCLAGVG